MKKLLFITAFPPSEIAAAEKNTKLMLADLAKSYIVDLIYFKDKDNQYYIPDDDNIHIAKVIKNSWFFRRINAITHPFYHPIFTVRYNSKVCGIIKNLIQNNSYSAIIFDHSQSLLYARKLKFDGPKILLSHDVEAQRFERSSNKLLTSLCKKTEKYVLNSDNAVVFTFCQKDVDIIKDYYGINANVCLDYIDERIINFHPKKIDNSFVLFGNWRRADNYEGAIWLLNGLARFLKKPITINVIGKHFPIELIQESDSINVNVLGFVDNPYPMIAESKAMLCPLFSGAGIKVKVIESLASGTPVIGTDIAFEGFPEVFNGFMLRAQDLNAFASRIESINYSLDERTAFKELFVSDYNSLTIPKWLVKNIGS
jgi:glycosyltransferase involved in cell wall biosynthesis